MKTEWLPVLFIVLSLAHQTMSATWQTFHEYFRENRWMSEGGKRFKVFEVNSGLKVAPFQKIRICPNPLGL